MIKSFAVSYKGTTIIELVRVSGADDSECWDKLVRYLARVYGIAGPEARVGLQVRELRTEHLRKGVAA